MCCTIEEWFRLYPTNYNKSKTIMQLGLQLTTIFIVNLSIDYFLN